MHAEDRIRLNHMLEACEAVTGFVAGRVRADLDTDLMLMFAVVRAVEIVGEAAGKISDETQAAHPEIPWKAMVGMRNRLVHAYFQIDANTVWVAVTQEIPALLAQLRDLAEKGKGV